MGLWIRSQNKKQLIKVVEIYTYNHEEGNVEIGGAAENGAVVFLRKL